MKGFMYILECSDGYYYVGSTSDLDQRIAEHMNGEGANFTRKHKPYRLLYFEEYDRIDDAFFREKQIQGWSKNKKLALIKGELETLHELSKCKNVTSNTLLLSASTSLSEREIECSASGR